MKLPKKRRREGLVYYKSFYASNDDGDDLKIERTRLLKRRENDPKKKSIELQRSDGR